MHLKIVLNPNVEDQKKYNHYIKRKGLAQSEYETNRAIADNNTFCVAFDLEKVFCVLHTNADLCTIHTNSVAIILLYITCVTGLQSTMFGINLKETKELVKLKHAFTNQ